MNPRPVNRKSNALPTSPHHTCTDANIASSPELKKLLTFVQLTSWHLLLPAPHLSLSLPSSVQPLCPVSPARSEWRALVCHKFTPEILNTDAIGDNHRLSVDVCVPPRDVTKFAFEFDNVRTSNVFSRFEIRRIFHVSVVEFEPQVYTIGTTCLRPPATGTTN